MWKFWKLFLITFCVKIFAEEDGESRQSKLLPIFQVVRFPNDVCTGTTRNGTCFTAEECSTKGGVNEGSCASGFGVCCVIKIACGGTTSLNNSYIVQTGVTTLTSPCSYSVCPCASDICRIRYDFTSHTLATQVVFTAADTPTDANLQNYAIGDCTTDQFTITSPGKHGSPLICGTNSGQHMILDSDGTNCQNVNFNIGASTTTTRSWDIYITMYGCDQEDEAGPPGCLQYFTGSTGLVKSFGYLTSNTNAATDAATTHLQNQNYNICVRREKGNCYICWSQWEAGSFGLSVPVTADVIAESAQHGDCTADWVLIPQGTTSAIAATTTVANTFVDRYCGRFLSTIASTIAAGSVCSRSYPFQLGVYTDDNEVCGATTANMAQLCEAGKVPGGILGFALGFTQSAC